MSVKSHIEKRKLDTERELKEKELDVQRESSKRGFLGNVIGAVSSIIPKGKYDLGGKFKSTASSLSKGNGPEWYKKFIPNVESVTNIPTWIKVSRPLPEVTCGSLKASDSIGILNSGNSSINYIGGNSISTPLGIIDGQTGTVARVIVHKFMPTLSCADDAYVDGSQTQWVWGNTNQNYAINRATMMTITELGKVNSRAIENDVSIPGMYFVAGTEIYSFLSELKFVIDTAVHYQDNDNTIPRALIEAKGYSYSDVVSNLPEYRKQYHILREYALSAVPLPDNLTLLARRIWMNSVVIKDTENEKASVMMFAQEAFGILSDEGDKVSYASFNPGTYTKSNITLISAYINKMIESVAVDEEFLTFISNMRAAGVKFAPIIDLDVNMNYVIEANDEVKLQLQNILTLPRGYAGILPHLNATQLGDWTVFHDPDGFMYQLDDLKLYATDDDPNATDEGEYLTRCAEARVLSKMCTLFNSYVGWDTDKMLVATRLHPLFYFVERYNGAIDFQEAHLHIAACGTEIVLFSDIYDVTMANTGSGIVPNLTRRRLFSIELGSMSVSKSGSTFTVTTGAKSPLLDLTNRKLELCYNIDGLYPVFIAQDVYKFLKFDIGSGSLVTDSSISAHILADLDDYIFINRKDLSRIHEVCGLSEYYLAGSDFKGFVR